MNRHGLIGVAVAVQLLPEDGPGPVEDENLAAMVPEPGREPTAN